jgi:hypothetical protein
MPVFYVEFNLRKRSPLTVENGGVIVDKGHTRITVRNIEADSHDDAIQKARPRAEAFLDDLHFRHGITLETGTGLGVGLQDSPEFRHSGYDAKLKVKGGHREKFPHTLKEVAIKPSDSKALYRSAAICQHPFDRFRNLFLVIENVASKIVKDWSNETELIKLALQTCFTPRLQDLEHFIGQYGFEYKGDIIDQVASELYGNYRTALFHSKANRDKKIPFKLEDERKVQRVLPLADFVAKSLLAYEDTYLLL